MVGDAPPHSEIRYRHLFESARDGIFVADAESGRVTDANPGMTELLDCTQEDLLGKNLWEIGILTDREASEAAWLHLQSTGFMRFEDLLIRTRQGSLRHVELNCNLYTEGDRRVVQGSIRDVTERKQREQSALEHLRASEETLRVIHAHSGAVIQNALDCIIIIDHENRVIEFNPAAEATFGYTRAEALVQDLNELIIPVRLHKAHHQGIAHYLKTGEGPVLNRRIEVPARRKDGGEITVELTATSIADSDPPHFIAYLRDITEQKRLQEQVIRSERLAAMGEMVAGVAHEINNPLAAIGGHAQLLQLHGDPQVREDAQIIQQMTDRVARIVRSLLAFSRRENVRERSAVPLSPLIDGTLGIVRHKLRGSDIEVVLDLADPDMAPSINAGQIEQVLLSLINNAEYALRQRQEGKKITLKTRRIRQKDGKWTAVLSVDDNGQGIPKEIIDRIFDPFFTTKPQNEGTGLGLSICYGIVEEHQGRLEVVSDIGIGTAFHLVLPLDSAAADRNPRSRQRT
jgi:two-component system NtrC family sensor kinase